MFHLTFKGALRRALQALIRINDGGTGSGPQAVRQEKHALPEGNGRKLPEKKGIADRDHLSDISVLIHSRE
jgi:hypothetical protein